MSELSYEQLVDSTLLDLYQSLESFGAHPSNISLLCRAFGATSRPFVTNCVEKPFLDDIRTVTSVQMRWKPGQPSLPGHLEQLQEDLLGSHTVESKASIKDRHLAAGVLRRLWAGQLVYLQKADWLGRNGRSRSALYLPFRAWSGQSGMLAMLAIELDSNCTPRNWPESELRLSELYHVVHRLYRIAALAETRLVPEYEAVPSHAFGDRKAAFDHVAERVVDKWQQLNAVNVSDCRLQGCTIHDNPIVKLPFRPDRAPFPPADDFAQIAKRQLGDYGVGFDLQQNIVEIPLYFAASRVAWVRVSFDRIPDDLVKDDRRAHPGGTRFWRHLNALVGTATRSWAGICPGRDAFGRQQVMFPTTEVPWVSCFSAQTSWTAFAFRLREKPTLFQKGLSRYAIPLRSPQGRGR